MPESVIVLEFNELCPTLIDRFIDEGRLPGFKTLRDQSVIYTTDADEEQRNLEPWIQWITVHTGLKYEEHRVFELGHGHKLNAPRLWDFASEAGQKVWICGSMNAAIRGGAINGFVLPDPWSAEIAPYPKGEFEAFFDLVRTYVQEHTREEAPVSARDHARFVAFMVAHGLSPSTVAKALSQLASERGGKNRWKRAIILDRLQWDLFRWYWRKHKPAYSTVFLNSTAHLQHYYWRAFEPEHFAVKPDEAELANFSSAIFVGYKAMDALIQEAMAMAPDSTIVLCTALSQQAMTKYDHLGGQVLHRVRDINAFAQFAGIAAPFTYAPVMAEEFRLYFETDAAAEDAEAKLAALNIDAAPAMRLRRQGREVYASTAVQRPQPDSVLVGSRLSNEARSFNSFFYPFDVMKSGCHHPDGALWLRRPSVAPQVVEGKIPLNRVAPTLAALIGIPDYQRHFSHAPLPEALGQAAIAVAAE